MAGALLLLDTARSHLFAYNAVAAAIWPFAEVGESTAAIAAELGDAFDLPLDAVRGEVDAIIGHWRAEGFFSPPPLCSTEPAIEPGPLPRRWAGEWILGAGGKRAFVKVEDAACAAVVGNLLGPMAVKNAGPSILFEVRHDDRGRHSLWRDGRLLILTEELGLVMGALSQALLEEMRGSTDWLALIHGGAVSLRGRAVGIAAPSGSGKSTLLAALVAKGFDYLADDLLAIAAPGGEVVPWLTPLSIKAGSWDVLAELRPELVEAPVYRTKGIDARLLLPSATAEPAPLCALVFPRFEPGAATRLHRLAPHEALLRLLGDRIWLGHPLEESTVRAFVAWLGRIPALALSYSCLGEAVAAVEGTIEA